MAQKSKEDFDQAIEDFIKQGFDPDEIDLYTDLAIAHINGVKSPGKLRILQNKQQILPNKGRCRILLRNNNTHDQIFLNHWINTDLDLNILDQQTLEYNVSDYSDVKKGEKKNVKIRFRSPQHLQLFKEKFEFAKAMNKEIYDHENKPN